jgi:hypothetical protein
MRAALKVSLSHSPQFGARSCRPRVSGAVCLWTVPQSCWQAESKPPVNRRDPFRGCATVGGRRNIPSLAGREPPAAH